MSSRHDTPKNPGEAPHFLRITTLATGEAAVCRIEGEIDQDQQPTLEDALARALRARPSRLLVDLAGVRFCDSACLNALLAVRRDAETAGVKLILTSPSSLVRRLLEITGADEVFTIRDSVRAALDGSDLEPRRRP